MLKIEKRKKEYIDENGDKNENEYLVVNGIVDEDAFLLEGGTPVAHFSNEKVIDLVTKNSFVEVGEVLSNCSFGMEVWWWENYIDLDVYCNEYYGSKFPAVKINLQLENWEHWARPWSMSSLAKQIELTVAELKNGAIEYWQEAESILNGFGIIYYPSNGTLIIKSEIDYALAVLKEVVDATNKILLESIDNEAVLTYFQFPEEIKTTCKQYLIYFTQFIADMGILVDTELKEELNHTLFKIIPKDKDESLEKIREALNIYLNAPNDKEFQAQVSKQTDIAAKQWEANCYHLKSQLILASSVIQMKEATIETLQLSNYQYKQLLESHSSKKESEETEIIKGIVAVKKYEGKVFVIDLPEIFKRLKRVFNR